MSSTRYAKPGSPLKQNRFASSSEFATGLLGNLVAKRCSVLESAQDRELIWMLQHFSHCDGGLKKVASDLREKFGDRLGSRRMREFGVTPGKSYNAEQVRAVRGELKSGSFFLLRGERRRDFVSLSADELLDERYLNATAARRVEAQERAAAANHPTSYLAADFVAACRDAACKLETDLTNLCLDPATGFDSIWYFHELRACLREYQTSQPSGLAPTALSRAIASEIDDVYEMGGAALLHNSAGNGKSCAADAYCQAHPGRARYVLTPATNDATDFWRVIAESLGSASGQSYKCIQIRDRVIQTLRDGDLVLVLDNCQWLFPVSDYRYALPNRINWVLELAERGVPVVMIADSKLFDTLGFVEARTGWNRSKFVNQLSRVVELPAALAKEDVQAVAAALLPEADRAAQRNLANYMFIAPGYLHSGIPAARRAVRIAASHQRDRVTQADMDEALETSMKPAFKALADGLKRADTAAAKCGAKARNWRPETSAQIAAKNGKRKQIVTSSDLKRAAGRGEDSEAAEPDFQSGTNRTATPDAVTSRRQIAPDLVTA